ncbi:MAG TPA: DUF3300 domain-containing protein [Rhizomicrobium sp.]|nr:DUF3300 domain-containing protein [Rhizomicrobium sp.]
MRIHTRRAAALAGLCAGLFVSALFWPRAKADDKEIGANSQIETLVAPVALFPDRLLAKILIASTYPLEVAEAANWPQRSAGSPNKAEDAQSQRWDPSIRDLATIPRLIVMMNDHLDWTQTLGDSFLSDPAAVLNEVQALRARAVRDGLLRTNEIQKVVTTTNGIEIRPVSFRVVRLPTYDPLLLHSSSKTSPPPQRSWTLPPGFSHVGKIAFLPAVAVPATVWDATIEWNEGQITVTRNLRPGNRGNPVHPADRVAWQHDPEHRRGVNYSTPELRARYGGKAAPGSESRRAFRGLQEPADGQDGLRDAGFFFRKHGGALDGVGDASQIDAFSRRGHQSLSPANASSKPKRQDVVQP